jgi:23S rRNA (adenine1618-N6)-methyltransferase
LHPKNIFSKDYDFPALIKLVPILKEHVFRNEFDRDTIKFSDNSAVKLLNKALLKSHYNIDWDLPAKSLCPPIPSRLDYLLYAADLIGKDQAKVLDIGTGANLIYPILAQAHLNWQCVGTDVDVEALRHAQSLIEKNKSLENIKLRIQKNPAKTLLGIINKEENFDLLICNPPFYKNAEEANKTNRRKVTNLKLEETETRNFGGEANELWYPGGEKSFIEKLAFESKFHARQVRWFTSLVSKKDNVYGITKSIKKAKPTDFKVIEMKQGQKISRFVAWTFF